MKKLTCLILFTICLLTKPVCANLDSLQLQIDQYISKAQFGSAKDYILSKLETENQYEQLDYLNYQLVKVLFIQSDYNQALKHAFKALDDTSSSEQITKLNFIIGCVYSAISDYQKSIDYFDMVINQSLDSSLIVQTHLLSSELYLLVQDTTKAIKTLTEAYEITNNADLDQKIKKHVSIQYNYFSQNYAACKKENFEIIEDSTSYLSSKTYALSMIADCLIKEDSLLEATIYLEEFLELTFKTKDPEQIKIAATKLIEVHEKLGNQQKANTYHKIYNEADKDSLSFSIEKFRSLYNIEKERELNTSKKDILRSTLLWGLTLIALFTFIVFYYFKKKQKSIKLKKESIKKIVINDDELEKIKAAVDKLVSDQLFLKAKITRKSFCLESKIKSERYLSHYINDKYKKSFSVFLNELRIEYAYNRIQKDDTFRRYTIDQIAKESGFGSKKSFERVFLAKYDITPYKLILSITN